MKSVDGLLERMTALMQINIVGLSTEEMIERVMEKLHLFGFQFEMVPDDGNVVDSDVHLNKLTTFYYVLDELGSRFTQSEDPNFVLVPIFYAPENCAITLCWPIKDIAYGEKATVRIHMPLDDFSNQNYWQRRYEIMGSEMLDEWYFSFAEIREFLTSMRKNLNGCVLPPLLVETSSILIPGCGNSAFSFDLFQAGYTKIVNIDYSPACIDQMRAKYQDCPSMTWHVGDATALSDIKEEFDLILDKGCFDAIVSGNDATAGLQYVSEMHRLLSSSGRFLLFSLGAPDIRLPLLESKFAIEMYSTRDVYNEMTQNNITRNLVSTIHVYICKSKEGVKK